VTQGYAPLAVNFTSCSTGEITTTEWNWNADAIPDAFGLTASHVFEAGTHTVVLRVTGPGGSADEVHKTINVSLPPNALFSADVMSGQAPLAVTFTNQTDGEAVRFLWDFDGDGTNDRETSNVGETVAFTYVAAGSYQVVLTAIGSDDTSSTATVLIVVEPPPPPTEIPTDVPADTPIPTVTPSATATSSSTPAPTANRDCNCDQFIDPHTNANGYRNVHANGNCNGYTYINANAYHYCNHNTNGDSHCDSNAYAAIRRTVCIGWSISLLLERGRADY
jgi:PKD repeat protein